MIVIQPEIAAPFLALPTVAPEVFRSNGPGRRFCMLRDTDLSVEAERLLRHYLRGLGVRAMAPEPIFGCFLGVNEAGAAVHEHRDPAPEGFWHTRINFMLQRPDAGGMPIMDGIIYDIDEGCGWICFASRCFHSTTPVEGARSRIVLSLGALLPDHEARTLQQKVSS